MSRLWNQESQWLISFWVKVAVVGATTERNSNWLNLQESKLSYFRLFSRPISKALMTCNSQGLQTNLNVISRVSKQTSLLEYIRALDTAPWDAMPKLSQWADPWPDWYWTFTWQRQCFNVSCFLFVNAMWLRHGTSTCGNILKIGMMSLSGSKSLKRVWAALFAQLVGWWNHPGVSSELVERFLIWLAD